MKDFKKPPFQQKAIAIGFTAGVHVIAVVGLLYLGMSKPPEPPKQIKTVLIKPEDLKPVTREKNPFDETAHENAAEEITQTAEPSIEPAPVIPAVPVPAPAPQKPDTAKLDAQKAAQQAKAAEQTERKAADEAKRAEQKRKAD